jgi:hypothetical protein
MALPSSGSSGNVPTEIVALLGDLATKVDPDVASRLTAATVRGADSREPIVDLVAAGRTSQGMAIVTIPSWDPDADLALMAGQAGVVMDRDATVSLTELGDPYRSKQWALDVLNTEASWDVADGAGAFAVSLPIPVPVAVPLPDHQLR